MKFLKKKENNENAKLPINGLMEDARDYCFYDMRLIDTIIGFAIGFGIAFLGFEIFFGMPLISAILGAIAGVKSIGLYKESIIKKNKRTLLLQFRELLDSLCNSLAVGSNLSNSFESAYTDMVSEYGDESFIAQEVDIIVGGVKNGLTIEKLLDNFAERSHLEDIEDFCNTLNTCVRLGGNLKEIVRNCRDIISSKIDIELEIQTIIAGSKNQLNIIIFMPFMIVAMMRLMGFEQIMEMNATNIATKVGCLVVFAFSYIFGQKMTKIEM